jgi:hypothetical protein
MLAPAKLLHIFTELLLVPLGSLLVWVALTGRFWWDRRSPVWVGLGVVLIYWGVRAFARAGRYATRWEHRTRGGSLALLGVMMLAIAALPFAWVQPLLVAAGGVVATRGVVCAALAARNP